jgi:hypothetical protein
MTTERVSIHKSRRCTNCDHIDTSNEHQCKQLVSMADGSAMPADFACGENQTAGEFRLDLHWPAHVMVLPV